MIAELLNETIKGIVHYKEPIIAILIIYTTAKLIVSARKKNNDKMNATQVIAAILCTLNTLIMLAITLDQWIVEFYIPNDKALLTIYHMRPAIYIGIIFPFAIWSLFFVLIDKYRDRFIESIKRGAA